MSPSPSLRHQWITANIIGEFRNGIKNSNCNHCKVYDFIDIKIQENTIVQPDCSIICKPAKGKFLDFPPELVVEVLSKETALKDRHTKLSLYEKFKIKYYLIVDPDIETVEIYSLNKSKYALQKTAAQSFTFSLHEDCNLKLLPANIWK